MPDPDDPLDGDDAIKGLDPRHSAMLNLSASGDPALVFATLYVGDQVRRLADAVDRDVAEAPPPLPAAGRRS